MSFIINILVKALVSFLIKFVTTFATDKMFSYTLFSLLKAGAKSTKTEWDDEWVARMEETYKTLGK